MVTVDIHEQESAAVRCSTVVNIECWDSRTVSSAEEDNFDSHKVALTVDMGSSDL